MVYETNNHVVPVCFAHFVGTECEQIWTSVFQLTKDVPGFDVPGRVTIVNQEKSIDKDYRNTMTQASLFLDQLHVKKNITALIGNKRTSGVALCQLACSAPSKDMVDTFKSQ